MLYLQENISNVCVFMQNIFKNKLFLTLKLSDLISNLGDVIFYMALMNYVLLLDQPALAVSIVTLSGNCSYIVKYYYRLFFRSYQTQNQLDLKFHHY